MQPRSAATTSRRLTNPARWLRALGQAIIVCVLLWGGQAWGQISGPAPRALLVQKIIIQHEGQPAASEQLIRANIRLKAGGPYSRKASDDDIHNLRKAYRLIFAQEGTMTERLEDVAELFTDNAAVMEIVNFIKADTSRSICQPIMENAA